MGSFKELNDLISFVKSQSPDLSDVAQLKANNNNSSVENQVIGQKVGLQRHLDAAQNIINQAVAKFNGTPRTLPSAIEERYTAQIIEEIELNQEYIRLKGLNINAFDEPSQPESTTKPKIDSLVEKTIDAIEMAMEIKELYFATSTTNNNVNNSQSSSAPNAPSNANVLLPIDEEEEDDEEELRLSNNSAGAIPPNSKKLMSYGKTVTPPSAPIAASLPSENAQISEFPTVDDNDVWDTNPKHNESTVTKPPYVDFISDNETESMNNYSPTGREPGNVPTNFNSAIMGRGRPLPNHKIDGLDDPNELDETINTLSNNSTNNEERKSSSNANMNPMHSNDTTQTTNTSLLRKRPISEEEDIFNTLHEEIQQLDDTYKQANNGVLSESKRQKISDLYQKAGTLKKESNPNDPVYEGRIQSLKQEISELQERAATSKTTKTSFSHFKNAINWLKKVELFSSSNNSVKMSAEALSDRLISELADASTGYEWKKVDNKSNTHILHNPKKPDNDITVSPNKISASTHKLNDEEQKAMAKAMFAAYIACKYPLETMVIKGPPSSQVMRDELKALKAQKMQEDAPNNTNDNEITLVTKL